MSRRSCKIREVWERGGSVSAIIVLETNDEQVALAEEKRLVALYGRANLTNESDGGDGKVRRNAEYIEGPEAAANFERAMHVLFQTPRSRTPDRPRRSLANT
jgi:hypothetical protein